MWEWLTNVGVRRGVIFDPEDIDSGGVPSFIHSIHPKVKREKKRLEMKLNKERKGANGQAEQINKDRDKSSVERKRADFDLVFPWFGSFCSCGRRR